MEKTWHNVETEKAKSFTRERFPLHPSSIIVRKRSGCKGYRSGTGVWLHSYSECCWCVLLHVLSHSLPSASEPESVQLIETPYTFIHFIPFENRPHPKMEYTRLTLAFSTVICVCVCVCEFAECSPVYIQTSIVMSQQLGSEVDRQGKANKSNTCIAIPV